MNLYAILRRSGFSSPEDIQEAAVRSKHEVLANEVQWIRSYVLEEAGGAVGTICIYEASSPQAIRNHAARAELPVDEIIGVIDTVVVRPDPVPVAS